MAKQNRRRKQKRHQDRLDPDKPPLKGAYRHPNGSWVLPRPKDERRLYVSAVEFNENSDPEAYAFTLLEIALRLEREGRLDELLGAETDQPDNKAA